MQVTTTFFIALLLASITTFGQYEIKVHESGEDFESGRHNSLSVDIYEANDVLIIKEWKKLMKDYDAKVSVKEEIFADNVLMKKISPNTFDIYARIEKNSNGDSRLIVCIDLGGAYLSSTEHPDKYKIAEKLLYDFAVSTAKEALKEQLKAEEKILSGFEKEKIRLIKEYENLQDDTATYRQKIKEAEFNINTNLTNQDLNKKSLEEQGELIKKVNLKIESVK